MSTQEKKAFDEAHEWIGTFMIATVTTFGYLGQLEGAEIIAGYVVASGLYLLGAGFYRGMALGPLKVGRACDHADKGAS